MRNCKYTCVTMYIFSLYTNLETLITTMSLTCLVLGIGRYLFMFCNATRRATDWMHHMRHMRYIDFPVFRFLFSSRSNTRNKSQNDNYVVVITPILQSGNWRNLKILLTLKWFVWNLWIRMTFYPPVVATSYSLSTIPVAELNLVLLNSAFCASIFSR